MAVPPRGPPAPAVAHAPARWRGKPVQVAVIVAIMVVAFAALRDEFPWPVSLTWVELPAELDDLQNWLLDQRTAADPNIVFAILDGFRALAEWLVGALNDFLIWLTWVGTVVAGTLIVL